MKKLLIAVVAFTFCCGFFGSDWYEEIGFKNEDELVSQQAIEVVKGYLKDGKDGERGDMEEIMSTLQENEFALQDRGVLEIFAAHLPAEEDEEIRKEIILFIVKSKAAGAEKVMEDWIVGETHWNILKMIYTALIERGYYSDEALKNAKARLNDEDHHIYTHAATYIVNSTDKESKTYRIGLSRVKAALLTANPKVRKAMALALDISNNLDEELMFQLQVMASNDAHKRVRGVASNTVAVISRNTAARQEAVVKGDIPGEKVVDYLTVDQGHYASVTQDDYSVALVIGNRDYSQEGKSVPDVEFALNDAAAIKDYLIKVRGYREGNIIYLENSTQADMVSALGNEMSYRGKLFNWIRSGESDVFVFYSGHGAPSLTDGSGYLLPVNADPSTVELNGYSLDTLYANLAKLPAKSVTVVIDACFSGTSQAGPITRHASSITLRPINIPEAADNMNVLSATDVGEVASWDTETKHGLLTSYFLQGISGAADEGKTGNADKVVSLAEMKRYLGLEVSYMARRQYGREQNPRVSGDGEFVFSELAE